MQHLVRRKAAPAPLHDVAVADRLRGCIRHRHQVVKVTVGRHRQHKGVAIAGRQHRAHDPLDPRLACGRAVGVDIHLGRQRIAHAHVARLGVFHKVDGHAGDAAGDRIDRRGDLRAVDQPGVAGHLHRRPVAADDPPGQAADTSLFGRLAAREKSHISRSCHANQPRSLAAFSEFSSIRIAAKTDASKTSMRSVGSIFSY